MADVIGCQQKSAGAICIFAPEYLNTRDTAKQQSSPTALQRDKMWF